MIIIRKYNHRRILIADSRAYTKYSDKSIIN